VPISNKYYHSLIMCKLIGRFFFKLTDSKNLIGEFSNNLSKRNYTESADRIFTVAGGGKFDGDYYSTWYEEEEHESALAKLEIRQKPECENIYSLKWSLIRTNKLPDVCPTFRGEGIVCDGMLIGDYRNFNTIDKLSADLQS